MDGKNKGNFTKNVAQKSNGFFKKNNAERILEQQIKNVWGLSPKPAKETEQQKDKRINKRQKDLKKLLEGKIEAAGLNYISVVTAVNGVIKASKNGTSQDKALLAKAERVNKALEDWSKAIAKYSHLEDSKLPVKSLAQKLLVVLAVISAFVLTCIGLTALLPATVAVLPFGSAIAVTGAGAVAVAAAAGGGIEAALAASALATILAAVGSTLGEPVYVKDLMAKAETLKEAMQEFDQAQHATISH